MSKHKRRRQRNSGTHVISPPLSTKQRDFLPNNSHPTWYVRWRNYIRLGEISLIAAIVLSAIQMSDTIIMSALLLVAWLVSAITLAAEPSLTTTRKYVFGAAISIVFVVIGLYLGFRHQEKIPEPILTSQLQALTQLEKFIGGKDETGLRDLFDLPGILKFNIALIKRSIAPERLTKEESSAIDEFFSNGQSVLNLKYTHVTRAAKGGLRGKMLPGKVGLLNISRKYVTNRQELLKFESSPQLPMKVREAVKELDQTIEGDVNLLHDVLNEKLSQDPNNLLQDDDGGSPYFATTSNAYWDKFIGLKPKADKVLSEIRSYLKVQ